MTTLDLPVTHDFDPTVRPQDDLFGHVNGSWSATVEIPDDRAVYGSFDMLRDEAEVNVHTLIEEAAAADAPEGSEQRKIGDLYASFMAQDAIEAAGVSSLEPLLAQIDQVTDEDALVRLFGELAPQGIGGPLGFGVTVDRGNPQRYLMHMVQSGLGLPDASYYRLEEHAETRGHYEAFVSRMLGLAGLGGDAEAVAIVGLETKIASAHWERTAVRDAVKTYNLKTAAEVIALMPSAPLLFAAAGLSEQGWSEVCVMQPDVVEAVTTLLDEVELETWQLYLRWRVLTSYAPYLTQEIVEANFDFFGRTLTGAPMVRERWKRGVGFVEGVMGEAVGKLYVERHYPAAAEAKMAELVDNVLEAYRLRIGELEWMEQATRERALRKLAAFRPKIGQPVKWRDYSALEVRADDLIGNVLRASAFGFAYNVDKLSGPVDRDEWHMTPQTVNAYYNPPMNEIVFPAAILQPPFFDADIDPAYNYGAIGAVIGHEIGHGFDDQGSRYDGDGTLRDWWTESDRAAFDVKVNALIEQYDGFSPRELDDSHTVKGAMTVGENIGDLGGVAVAHHAYRLSVQASGGEAPVIDDLTGDQRFFIGWALAWRVASREAEAIRRLNVDVHSPPEFRVNVVRNIDAFHEAFDTQPGDGLWLAPDERVAIW